MWIMERLHINISKEWIELINDWEDRMNARVNAWLEYIHFVNSACLLLRAFIQNKLVRDILLKLGFKVIFIKCK